MQILKLTGLTKSVATCLSHFEFACPLPQHYSIQVLIHRLRECLLGGRGVAELTDFE